MKNNDFNVNLGKSKQVSSVVKQVVDKDTGEITIQEVEKVFITKVKTDNFFMCFFENFAHFYGLKHLSDIKLIASMCEEAEFNSGVVYMSKGKRIKICERAGISFTNMSKNLSRLVDSGLISESNGDYTINPAVFWKGSIKERIEVLRSGNLSFCIRLVEDSSISKLSPSKGFDDL